VRGDKQKAAGRKERKVRKESRKREREVGRTVKKARTHSERVPEIKEDTAEIREEE
jgi:hypothetical protein